MAKEASIKAHSLEPDRTSIEVMGKAVLERIADFVDGLSRAPAGGFDDTEQIVARMLQPPPEQAEDFTTLLDAFQTAAERSLDTAGPGYLAYFPAGGVVGSAFAELLAQTYNRFTAVAELAPALVAMEHGVLRWLCEQFGMPSNATGLVTTGGSMATLAALVAARHDRLGEDIAGGVLYVTEHTHYCVAKAARIAGLPASSIRIVPTRGLRLDPEAAARIITADRAAGLRPFLLVGTAGTTSTGTVDPLAELGELARQEKVWFHVDAAYGGGFQLTGRGRDRLRGIDRADSLVFDPHKSLFLPYGTGVLLVRDAGSLYAAHSGHGDYLQDLTGLAGLPDYGHLGPELTREFRGLRLWLPLHLHGVRAFRDALDEKLDLAVLAYQDLAADSLLEVREPDLTVVVFRLRGDDDANRRLLDRINDSGRFFLSSTRVDDRFYLRLNATNHRTHEPHLRDALDHIRRCARDEAATRPRT